MKRQAYNVKVTGPRGGWAGQPTTDSQKLMHSAVSLEARHSRVLFSL